MKSKLMKRNVLLGLIILCLGFGGVFSASSANACAGHTITIGSNGSLQQNLLVQVMSLLINRRTGTNIKMLRFDSPSELLAAAERHEVDLLVADIEEHKVQLLSSTELVTLEPFGFSDAQVAPVFHSATLKKFPALKRLIGRLRGTIDDDTLWKLQHQATGGVNLRELAKKFLLEQKLIFGS